jgi:hypothetical protein
MKTVKVKVFSLSELSEKAQQRAHDDYQSTHDEIAWSDENRQTLEAFEKVFPIQITDWSYGGRGEGVTFRSDMDGKVEELSGVRLATYLWNNYKNQLFEEKYYKSWQTLTRVSHKKVKSEKMTKETGWTNPEVLGKYWNKYKGLQLEHSCVLTGYCMDDEILDPIYAFLDKPRNINFLDLLEECFDAWIKACNRDVDYQNSFEYFEKEAEANDYEFLESGKRKCF